MEDPVCSWFHSLAGEAQLSPLPRPCGCPAQPPGPSHSCSTSTQPSFLHFSRFPGQSTHSATAARQGLSFPLLDKGGGWRDRCRRHTEENLAPLALGCTLFYLS